MSDKYIVCTGKHQYAYWQCRKQAFNSIDEADNYADQLVLQNNGTIKSTVIPINKWMPEIFYKTYIDYKLKSRVNVHMY